MCVGALDKDTGAQYMMYDFILFSDAMRLVWFGLAYTPAILHLMFSDRGEQAHSSIQHYIQHPASFPQHSASRRPGSQQLPHEILAHPPIRLAAFL